MAMEIPVRVQSRKKELKSIVFPEEKMEFEGGAELSYADGDAEFSGFEPEVIVEMEVSISSTESVSDVSEYLYDKLNGIDDTSIKVKGEEIEMDEEKIRRKLIQAYYRS